MSGQGSARGGAVPGPARIADRIAAVEGKDRPVECGALDITRFRDDGSAPAAAMRIAPRLAFAIDGQARGAGRRCGLYRTAAVRAAIDAIYAAGDAPGISSWRSLVDRGHRELPIRADSCGKNLPTSKEETVRVSRRETGGPERLRSHCNRWTGAEDFEHRILIRNARVHFPGRRILTV